MAEQAPQDAAEPERGTRMLRGVPPIPGWGPASGPLFSCLRAMGEPVGYPFLAALSGDAFRLRVFELRPYGPTDGADIARTLGDLGYEVKAVPAEPREQVAAAIRGAVEAGVPAIAWAPSTEAGPWFGVVVGCDAQGETVLLKTLGDGDAHRSEALERVAEAPQPGEPGLYVPGPKAAEPPLRELMWSALRGAVRLGHERVETSAEKHPYIGFGVRGYEAWANFLEEKGERDPSLLTEADTVHAVWRHLAVAVDMKQQAERFLRSAVEESDAEAEIHLAHGVELYHEVWDLLDRLLPDFSGFTRCRRALGDRDRREEMVHALRRAALLEELAIDAIAKALRGRA